MQYTLTFVRKYNTYKLSPCLRYIQLYSTGVGKSSLILNYISESSPTEVAPTIGASFYTFKMKLIEGKVKMQVGIGMAIWESFLGEIGKK